MAVGQLIGAADRSHNRSVQNSCGVIMKEFAGARKTLDDRFNERAGSRSGYRSAGEDSRDE